MKARTTSPVMHVALLRGINVGKAKRMAMADLRELCEAFGEQSVHALVRSGVDAGA